MVGREFGKGVSWRLTFIYMAILCGVLFGVESIFYFVWGFRFTCAVNPYFLYYIVVFCVLFFVAGFLSGMELKELAFGGALCFPVFYFLNGLILTVQIVLDPLFGVMIVPGAWQSYGFDVDFARAQLVNLLKDFWLMYVLGFYFFLLFYGTLAFSSLVLGYIVRRLILV